MAEKNEEEKRKSTADFASLKPRQHYHGCQSYTKSPCEPCQDRWELYVYFLFFLLPLLNVDELTIACSCQACICMARSDCPTVCAQSYVSLISKRWFWIVLGREEGLMCDVQGACQNEMCPNPKLLIDLKRPHHDSSGKPNDD
jgi:hypothetical protein